MFARGCHDRAPRMSQVMNLLALYTTTNPLATAFVPVSNFHCCWTRQGTSRIPQRSQGLPWNISSITLYGKYCKLRLSLNLLSGEVQGFVKRRSAASLGIFRTKGCHNKSGGKNGKKVESWSWSGRSWGSTAPQKAGRVSHQGKSWSCSSRCKNGS